MQGRRRFRIVDIRLGAYAYTVREDSLLLAQVAAGEADEGSWTLPGGGLDWGEHPEEGLARELWEETGLRGTVLGILGVDSLVVPPERVPSGRGLHQVRIVYRVDCAGQPSVMEQDGSVSDARWIPMPELSSLRLVDLVSFALERAAEV